MARRQTKPTVEQQFISDVVKFCSSARTSDDVYQFSIACWKAYRTDGLTFLQASDLIDAHWRNNGTH
jgi:hypothetical protein